MPCCIYTFPLNNLNRPLSTAVLSTSQVIHLRCKLRQATAVVNYPAAKDGGASRFILSREIVPSVCFLSLRALLSVVPTVVVFLPCNKIIFAALNRVIVRDFRTNFQEFLADCFESHCLRVSWSCLNFVLLSPKTAIHPTTLKRFACLARSLRSRSTTGKLSTKVGAFSP